MIKLKPEIKNLEERILQLSQAQAAEQQQNEYVSAFKLLTKQELDEVYEMILDLEKLETPQRDLSPEEKITLANHERRFTELLNIAAKRSPACPLEPITRR